jgi:hypothetical protein
MVKASNNIGVNGGVLGAAVSAISKAQGLKVETALMDYQHQLNLNRDTHREQQGLIASAGRAAIQHHYDTALEGVRTTELEKRGINQGVIDEQLEQQKHLNKIGQIDQSTAGAVKIAQKTAAAARATKKHASVTDLNSMKELSAGLAENHADPSKGISPLVAGPGQLQNIGNALKGHPLLNFDKSAASTSTKPIKKAKSKKASTPKSTMPKSAAAGQQPSVTPPVVTPAAGPKVNPARRKLQTAKSIKVNP